MTATATDGAGRTSTSTFSVTVLPTSAWQNATAIALTTAPTASLYGQPATFVATIGLLGPNAATPTGNVTFKDGNTTLGTGTIVTSDGVTTATFTTTKLAPGSHSITAVYGGGTKDLASTSIASTIVVAPDATTTTITAAPTSSAYGQTVTFTATVAAIAPGVGSPTGTVTFMDGTTTLGTATLRTTAGVTTATLTTSKLAPGSHAIAAEYGGGPDDLKSNSATSTFTVAQDTTTIVLVPSLSGSAYGQSVTFKATVAVVSPGAGMPTGTVTFMDGTTVLGTGKLSGSGSVAIATFTTSQLAVGSHSITAVYGGDTNDLGITSAISNLAVAQDATTIAVSASPSGSIVGQLATFKATVTVVSPGLGSPTGTVTFMDGTTVLGTGKLSTSGNVTTATFSTNSLALGSHSVTAVYGGDTDDQISTSAAAVFKVAQDKTTTTVTASSAASVYGQPVTFTATVAVASPGLGSPTGKITWMDGTTVLGTGTLSTSAGATTATFTTAALGVGSHSVTAVYAGDTDDVTSTSAAKTLQVARDATSVVVGASPSSTVYGQSVTFTATVALSGPGFGTPTGTVTFKDGATTLGTGTLVISGGVATASYTTASLVVGGHSVTAGYAGDTNHSTSSSVALALTVAPHATSTAIVAAPTTTVFGQSVTFKATVSVVSPGVGTPTGTVTFEDGSSVLGTGSLSTSGGLTTATFATTKLAAGRIPSRPSTPATPATRRAPRPRRRSTSPRTRPRRRSRPRRRPRSTASR